MAESEKSPRGWQVLISQAALKQKKKLPEKVVGTVARLIGEMEKNGPIRKNWPHFSALGRGKAIPLNSYHCHIKSGRPTYVALLAGD